MEDSKDTKDSRVLEDSNKDSVGKDNKGNSRAGGDNRDKDTKDSRASEGSSKALEEVSSRVVGDSPPQYRLSRVHILSEFVPSIPNSSFLP